MNLTGIDATINQVTGGWYLKLFGCECNNLYFITALVIAYGFFMWVVGYLTGGNVRKTE